jgi:hypothetical protein
VIALAGIHQQLRPYADQALAIARENGIPVTVTSVFRSLDFQRRLRANYELCLARGKSGQAVSVTPGMSCAYPANRPGDSSHNFGLAWDSITEERFQPFWNEIRRWVGWEVPPGDVIHAELPGWRRYLI